jgi:GH24 family phage-related lysozyme (muramidase)
MMSGAMDRETVKFRLKQLEGSIPHMYRCTGGAVTIGVGHALADATAAGALPWRIAGVPATPEQAERDFSRVAAARKGRPAASYAAVSTCRLAGADIDALLDGDIARFEALLQAALPEWTSYPEPARQALFDIAFNVGVAGLLKFRKLLAAVNAGDWETAAAECHRQGIPEARNIETARLFRECVFVGQTPRSAAGPLAGVRPERDQGVRAPRAPRPGGLPHKSTPTATKT